MANCYLFSDEAGCMTFNRNPNVSRYFIICTVSTSNLSAGYALHELRHQLVSEGAELGDCFHAATDKQHVRDRVFETILAHDFRIQATVCEKAKAQPQVRVSKARFYKVPWYFHLKHGLAPYVPENSHLIVTAASIGQRKERATYRNGLDDVASQNIKGATWCVDFRPAMADPWLQIADYCAWAIQRKWERGDRQSFDIIKNRITYEYELWRHGTTLYY
jgi:hypothetical protein